MKHLHLIAIAAMIAWSFAIWGVMELIGFSMHNVVSSLGASIMLFIGLVGNVWIYFLIMKETPWKWPANKS